MFKQKLRQAQRRVFFTRNREIIWTRRKLGLLLAITLIIGAYLGDAVQKYIDQCSIVRDSSFASLANADLLDEQNYGDVVLKPTEEGEDKADADDPLLDPCELKEVICEGENSIEEIISRMFPEDPKTALAIAKAESGMRADAKNINRNGSNDVGIFQINSIHGHSIEERLDPIENIRMAREIYERRGWEAWSAYNNQKYLQYYE